MTLEVITRREISTEAFPFYIDALQKAGVPIDADSLLNHGEWSFRSYDNGQLVRTRYRIIQKVGDR